jgi:hypothetical protein
VFIMMGSSFNRLLSGRRKRGRANTGTRDVVLAGLVCVLVFSVQGPELVDRWLWFPFILALCFRDTPATGLLPATATTSAAEMPDLVPATQAAPDPTTNGPRRVSGRIGRHAAPDSDFEV